MSDEPLPEVDIATLLAMTFEAQPSNELAERVQSRVAAWTTIAELGRLLTVAPWHWVTDDEGSLANEE